MAVVQGQFNLPLIAFQHHVGQLYIDPAEIQFVQELRQSDLAIVEQGRWRRGDGKVVNVICKVWRPFVVATPQDFRELLLEASKLHRLQHPNLTRFLGLGCFAHGSLAEVRESMFMVEKYVGRRTLRKLLSEQMRVRHKNLYTAATAVRWATEVASALAALHEQQPAYVHNDVKADNVLLTDTSRVNAAEAVLGDLKPHRHVYDREPSTLSQHHQQQRLLSSAKAVHPSSLQQPKYTLERSSICSSNGGGEVQQLSSSSNASSIAAAGAAAAVALPQHQQHQYACSGFAAKDEAAFLQHQHQQHHQVHPASHKQQVVVAADASCIATPDGCSWSSGSCSTVSTPPPLPQAAAAATAGYAAVVVEDSSTSSSSSNHGAGHVRSLPMPITARSNHPARGSSCPSNWHPGGGGGSPTGGFSGPTPPPAAAAASRGASSSCSPSYFSASSHHSGSVPGDASSSCLSSAPPESHSLAAEVAAADAEAAAAGAAAGVAGSCGAACGGDHAAAQQGGAGAASSDAAADGEGDGGVHWRAASRQRSGAAAYLSDSASSTSGRCRQGKGGSSLSSLTADADAEADDTAAALAAAGMEGDEVVSSSCHQQQQQQPQPQQQKKQKQAVQQGSRSSKGALATAFANLKQQSTKEKDQLYASSAAVDQAGLSQQQQQQHQGLLSALYKRSKSSPLEQEQQQQQPEEPRSRTNAGQLQLARSAPDVLQAGEQVDEAVHHGSLLMPLQLSEPTGLCSLQELSSSRHSGGNNRSSSSSQADLAALRAHKAAQAGHQQQLQKAQEQQQLKGMQQQQQGGGSTGSCVYYGWELLPSGAASPCGAVHSSMLDLFADVAGDDIVTSRRYRDSCQYTLVPGSFVQQRSPLSITTASAATTGGSGSAVRSSKSANNMFDVTAASSSNNTSSTSSSSTQTAASAWAVASASSLPLLQSQQQQQQPLPAEPLERAPSIGKGYAPSAIESKQHGGYSAFAALTAIDCIAEEGSSMATDSCAPSCCTSRESTAHGGSQFYLDGRAGKDMQQQLQLSKDAQQQQTQHPTLPSLVSASSLTRGLSALLRSLSSQGSFVTGSSSEAAEDGQDTSSSTIFSSSSPAVSPRAGMKQSYHNNSRSSLESASSLDGTLQDKSQWEAAAAAAATSRVVGRPGALKGSQSQPAAAIDEASSDAVSAAAGVEAAAAAPTKKVRFSLTRPEGCTASRDFSLLYAAPELVRGERPTEKVDVFAVGVLLYELLSRRLIASSVAEVCSRNNHSSRRGNRYANAKQQQQQQQQQESNKPVVSSSTAAGSGTGTGSSEDDAWVDAHDHDRDDDDDEDEYGLPEHQLLLTYAQLVATGYRPPMLPHFPEPVVQLISSCWAAEPHERPRMAEVLQELRAWQKHRALLATLNNYVPALADMGYHGGKQPGCGCVIS